MHMFIGTSVLSFRDYGFKSSGLNHRAVFKG